MKYAGAIGAFLAVTCVSVGQTRIDMRTQTKQVDLADADWTRPVKTGSALPGVCVTGELFFLTTAAPGQNLLGCVAPNQWSGLSSLPELPGGTDHAGKLLVSTGTEPAWAGGDVGLVGGAIRVNSLQGYEVAAGTPVDGDILIWRQAQNRWITAQVPTPIEWMPSVERTSDVTLTVGRECSASTPCRMRFGNKIQLLTNSATISIVSGTGTLWVSVDAGGVIQAGYSGSMTLACSNCTLAPDSSGFAPQSLAIWRWTASTERKWDNTGSTDMRALLSREAPLLAGSGLVVVEDGATGSRTLHLDTAVAQTHESAQSGGGTWCSAPADVPNSYACTVNPGLQNYTAGMVLVFRPSASNSGPATLNAGAGAASLVNYSGTPLQPAELTAGAYYHVVYTGSQYRILRPGTPVSDDSTIELTDEFLTRANTTFGTLGWTAGNLTGNAFSASIHAEAAEPGYVRIATGDSGTAAQISRAGAYLRSDPGATTGYTAFGLAQPGWTYRARVRLLDATATGAAARIGFAEDVNSPGGNSLYVKYETGVDGGAWALYSGGTKLLQSTVTVAANVWNWISVSSTSAGSVTLSVDGETPQTAAAGIPPALMGPFVDCEFPAGAWTSMRGIDMGKWVFRQTGIVR